MDREVFPPNRSWYKTMSECMLAITGRVVLGFALPVEFSPSNLARPIIVSLSATHEDQFRQKFQVRSNATPSNMGFCALAAEVAFHPWLDA